MIHRYRSVSGYGGSMRLKLSLASTGGGPKDVEVTVDATATIGDIARRLASSDLENSDLAEELTLRVHIPGQLQTRLLNPLLSVHDSALRSGSTVEVAHAGAPRSSDQGDGHPVALLSVIEGPDAGAEFTLLPGVNHVGRNPAAHISLHDEQVSRRHASITVADTVVVTDLNSANGLEVNGMKVNRDVLTLWSQVRVGDTVLQLRPLTKSPGGSPSLLAVAGAEAAFFRSPRVEATFRGSAIPAPELPLVPEKTKFPMLAVVAPVVMGTVLFVVTQQIYSLIFIALTPVIMLGTWIENRSQNRRRYRDDSARFDRSMAATRNTLMDLRSQEVASRVAESPSVADVVEAIRSRSDLLWTRKPEHATFLEVRLGTGTQSSRSSVVPPTKNSARPEDWDRVTCLVDEFRAVDGVPVIENLERAGSIGVAGAGPQALAAARALVLQLAALHSPADLVLTAFAAGDTTAKWDWLKWLPHLDSPYSPIKSKGLAGDYATASLLLAELEGLVVQRRQHSAGRGTTVRSRLDEFTRLDEDHGTAVDTLPATPAVVALVTAESPADRARLVALAEEGPDVGVFLIWLAATTTQLPVVCRTYVHVDDNTWTGTVGFVRTGQTVALDSFEQLDDVAALTSARLLAPVDDAGAQVLDESDLPRSVAFLELFDAAIATDDGAVVSRWAKNDSLTSAWTVGVPREPGGIRTIVGQGPIEPFAIDLRAHGPHALIGGTTGSGKSEFLQAWIMGIAAEYSPERVNFLLVDFKGGTAFAECKTLPHTVGLVTDLNTHLVRRVLTSLRAELKHRERILRDKGAKDLQDLEARSDPDAPAALIIVVDEFAALATEVPEFVDGMIDIAQRGRSLGLHLVMATQRPAGVIKDNLRANTNLRIALRVADEADSQDVLGTSSAAYFDPATPGRAAAKLGPGRVTDFQAAYLGGYSTATVDAASEIEVAELTFGRGSTWASHSTVAVRGGDEPKDIERLSVTISGAARRLRLPSPRRPWLDQLPTTLDLLTLPVARTGALRLGIIDEPETQRQRLFELDLDGQGNIAIFGTGGTGKSTFLRTLAVSAARAAETDLVHVYGLDFSGGALSTLESLRTVGSIISGGDTERVSRLIRHLTAIMLDRTRLFSAARASTLTEYRSSTGINAPRLLVLIDGMATFRAEFEFSGTFFDEFTKLFSAGRQVGIHFAVTADRLAAFPSALLANIQQRIVLRLATDTEYAVLGVPGDVLIDAPAGRALVASHEVQLAVVAGSPDLAAQAAATVDLIGTFSAVDPAPEIQRLADLIPTAGLPDSVNGQPLLGVSDETLQPVGIPLDGLFVVSGPFGSGRTTAMQTIIQSIRRTRPDLAPYLLVARRSALTATTEWQEVAQDPDDADALANRLATMLERPGPDRTSDMVIVLENVGDFEGLMAESAIARLIKAARRADVPVIAEADTVTAGAAWQIYSELKTARAGIVLQPEETDGMSLFRVQFPRVTRADFPVGRGILVVAGRPSRVQVAFPQLTRTAQHSIS